ncbi:MAG TPA: Dyp-type peroxidase [Pseudonocardiaceae bacterium]
MADATPQPVLGPLTEAAIFLVVTIPAGAEAAARDLLADLGGLVRAVGFRVADGGLSCVAGIGADLWPRMIDGNQPAHLHPFRVIEGPTRTAVATPGDLLFHIRANRPDLCFELAALLTNRLARQATVVDEVHGFQYFDRRDLLGFVDGTENPDGDAARAAVTVGDEDPEFAGGSYVIVQKYLHDMDAWNAISVEEQERAVGRTKLSDVELDEKTKPSNSHVALNTITDENGEQVQIVRANMPFGRLGASEFGTYFIGYAADPAAIEQMLTNMFVGNPPGNTDRILDFSEPVTGGLFFVPNNDFLDGLSTPAGPAQGSDSSLNIGSLKRSARS